MTYRAILFQDFQKTGYYSQLSQEKQQELKITTAVFPFKTNTYINENLINWKEVDQDPIFKLIFPNKGMIPHDDYTKLLKKYEQVSFSNDFIKAARYIRDTLIPQDLGCPSPYIPKINSRFLYGFLHQFPHTLVAMIKPARVCFAHCSHCLVWPIHAIKGGVYGYEEPYVATEYLKCHPQVTDIFFTGGDTLHLTTSLLKKYLTPLLVIPSLHSIRLATRTLSWWPYRFTRDQDADELLDFFKEIQKKGKHLTIIAHVMHPCELQSPKVVKAIQKIQSTGTIIRCQTPLARTINDSTAILVELLQRQIKLGLIPYYLFVDANTSAPGYFKISLARAYSLFSETMKQVTGLAKTLQGPVITNNDCKIAIIGIEKINREPHFILQCLQSPDPNQKGAITSVPFDPDMVDFTGTDITFR